MLSTDPPVDNMLEAAIPGGQQDCQISEHPPLAAGPNQLVRSGLFAQAGSDKLLAMKPVGADLNISRSGKAPDSRF